MNVSLWFYNSNWVQLLDFLLQWNVWTQQIQDRGKVTSRAESSFTSHSYTCHFWHLCILCDPTPYTVWTCASAFPVAAIRESLSAWMAGGSNETSDQSQVPQGRDSSPVSRTVTVSMWQVATQISAHTPSRVFPVHSDFLSPVDSTLNLNLKSQLLLNWCSANPFCFSPLFPQCHIFSSALCPQD